MSNNTFDFNRDVKHDVSLKLLNTFNVDVRAKYFIAIETLDKLVSMLPHYEGPLVILGGGSNTLFTRNIDGLVIHMCLKGIRVIHENDTHATINAFAGEIWDDFVKWCIKNGYGGLENLSLIPGYVGAAPVQNIGAYGVEAKDLIAEVAVIHRYTGQCSVFRNCECLFKYRSSIFNTSLQNDYIVISVTFLLTKNTHNFRLSFPIFDDIRQSETVTLQKVAETVISTRQCKLPDTDILGNAGSFFRNPFISPKHLNSLQSIYLDIPCYYMDGKVKIPAAWLIDQCKWKGRLFGRVGVYKNHAAILVNYGDTDGKHILNLSISIQLSVFCQFGIWLWPEVKIYQ